ncbi:MAG: hypothetical protein JO038_07680, partial [Alphaproteobacteria bacterium]|nr:hypothetical protein [Alphaproteobacteria bacterium]
MLSIVSPPQDAILELQNAEGALYFSIGAEAIIRRCGYINVRASTLGDKELSDPRTRTVLTRMTRPEGTVLDALAARPSAFEGPVAASVLDHFGLRGEVQFFKELGIYDAEGRSVWAVRRSETSAQLPQGGVGRV